VTAPTSTIPGALEEAVGRFGQRPWMAFRDEVRSFSRLWRDVEAIARGLAALGLASGERAGLYMDNRFEWLQTEYAVSSLGAWLVPINTYFRSRELDHVLSQSAVEVLIWTDPLLGRPSGDLLLELVPELSGGPHGEWRSERFPNLRAVVGIGAGPWPPGVLEWDAMLERGASISPAELEAARAQVKPDDIALLMYTSGTTGRPKGAMLRHRSVVDHIRTWARHLELRDDDRSIMSSPLFWSFGCTVNAVVPLQCGSMITLQERFDPLAFLQDIVAHECTHLQGVPSQYEMALKHPETLEYDLSRLRLVQIGGSASADGLARRILERAPEARFISAYGLTEGVGVNTYTRLDDPLERVMQTVGAAAEDNEVAVMTPDGDQLVAAGEVGELCIRGENVMVGYLDNPAATDATLRGGWLRTGDLATMDADGYVRIVGRHIDAYKRGGMNVYPAEAEAVLGEHPAVQAVAIVGVPDDRLGEVGAAFVLPRAGATLDLDELRAYCSRRIAAYKVPDHVIAVDEFPLTPTGKVQKYLLKERYPAPSERA
jgi:acyl-CoA synthetase (AMP-forming)/AMP-acid ligase II